MSILHNIIPIFWIVAFIATVVLWVIALYGAITRQDLKNSRGLLITLLLLVAPIGAIVYFFSEGRKKQGVTMLVIYGGVLVLMPVLYAILNFITHLNDGN